MFHRWKNFSLRTPILPSWLEEKKPLPAINSYRHFRFDSSHPGKVFAWKTLDSSETELTIMTGEASNVPVAAPSRFLGAFRFPAFHSKFPFLCIFLVEKNALYTHCSASSGTHPSRQPASTSVTHLDETSPMSAEFVFRYGPKCMGGLILPILVLLHL